MSETKKIKKFISYFQSVTTVGIMTCAKNYKEASEQAKDILDARDINYCHFDQTGLELSDTVEWNPEFEIVSEDPTEDGHATEWGVKIGDKMKNIMAERLGKSPDELTPADCSEFVSDALRHVIETNGGEE